MSNEPSSTTSRNVLKAKLARGDLVSSMIVRMWRGIEIGRLARTCGFDALYVDLEHGVLSADTASQICVAAQDAGVTPLVRVSKLSSDVIAQALDGGAMGVVVPHVNSAEQARRAVEWVKFTPPGTRSMSSHPPQLGYRSMPQADAMAALDAETLVAVMIESREGLDNVESIAAVPGIDLLIVGCGDLSAALGIPGELESTVMDAAVRRVLKSCVACGKAAGLGGLAGAPHLQRRYVTAGARFVSAGSDVSFLMRSATVAAEFVAGLKE